MGNKQEQFYRFVVDEVGIYEAVDRDCPPGDARRKDKPDGSWLPKMGRNFPGAVSLWSEYGLKKYRESGLLDWHRDVVRGKVEMIIISQPTEVLYKDKYQLIVKPEHIVEISHELF